MSYGGFSGGQRATTSNGGAHTTTTTDGGNAIGGLFGISNNAQIASGGHASAELERPPSDVNVAYVVENPREQSSLLGDLVHTAKTSWSAPHPPPTLTLLPDVTRRDFAGYVSQLKSARARLGLSASDAAALFEDATAHAAAAPADDVHGSGGGGGAGSHRHSLSAGAVSSPAMSQLYARLRSSAGGHESITTTIAGADYIDAFKVAPIRQFFEPTYDTRDPRTFSALLKSDGSLEDVQERLSGYLDVVECQLLALIKSRSAQFFEALRDLQELQQRVTDANGTAAGLVERVEKVKNEVAVQPLLVVHATRRRQRGTALRDALRTVSEALQATARVARLISGDDLMGALSVIHSTRALIAGRLQRVNAAMGLHRQLDDFERLVGDTLVARYATQAVALAIVGAASQQPATAAGATAAASALALPPGSGPGATASTSSSSASLEALLSPVKASPPLNMEEFLLGGARPPSSSSALSAVAVAITADAVSMEEVLHRVVRPTLDGLAHTGRLGGALESFQAALVSELKMFVRSEVTEALTAAEVDTYTGTAAAHRRPPPTAAPAGAGEDTTPARIAALSPSLFVSLLTQLCRSLLDVLRRVHSLHDMVETALDAAASAPQPPQQQQLAVYTNGAAAPTLAPLATGLASTVASASRLRALSCGVMGVAVDAVQRHVARLLSLRRDPGVPVRVSDIKSLWDAGSAFTVAANSLLARMGGGGEPSAAAATAAASLSSSSSSFRLVGAAPSSPVLEECIAQARTSLTVAHTRNVRTLGAVLDAEQWSQADIPSVVQALADAITASGAAVMSGSSSSSSNGAGSAGAGVNAGGSSTERASSFSALVVAASALDGGDAAAPTAPAKASTPPMTVARALRVRGASYFMVGAAVMLVRMLGDYSALADAIPDVAADVIRMTVELLRQFNRRSTELVLGAGAMASANLRRITAKHLALAAQSLGAVLALLPSLRAALIMRLPPHQHVLLSELTRVTADFMQHEKDILLKFVVIVKELLVKCCDDMRVLPWGDPNTPLTVPTAPMRELVKGVSTLHKILEPVLRPDQLDDVFTRVAVMVGAQVPVQYTGLLAHLADVAAQASIAAATRGSSGSSSAGGSGSAATSGGGGGGGLGASPTPLLPFSRRVANERLAADLRVFILALSPFVEGADDQQQAHSPSPSAPAAAGSAAAAGHDTRESGHADDSASASPGQQSAGSAALHSLGLWSARLFGADSIVMDYPALNGPGTPGGEAAAEEAAAEAAAEAATAAAAVAAQSSLAHSSSSSSADDAAAALDGGAALAPGSSDDGEPSSSSSSLASAVITTAAASDYEVAEEQVDDTHEGYAMLSDDVANPDGAVEGAGALLLEVDVVEAAVELELRVAQAVAQPIVGDDGGDRA